MNKSKDTIFAVSTPPGKSAVAIIRISGREALNIVSKISSNMPTEPNKSTLNNILINNKNVIDQTITTLFKSPKSFTGEDIVEISLHGSSAVLNKILNILGDCKNCRLAEPGEFTKRAFENNKLDLTQAEAVLDLVNSETEEQRKQAINQLGGKLSKKTNLLSNKILKVLANIEAIIDFTDDDLPDDLIKKSKEQIMNICEDIKHILKDNNIGEKIRSGFIVTIIGKPNTGKSSFINYIAKRDIAIVTEDPGTTRDIIEVLLDFNGFPIKFYDTAGLRKSNIKAEKIGVEKAYRLTKNADINLVFIDSINEINDYKNIHNILYVQSKIDIYQKISTTKQIFHISTKTGDGFDDLFSHIMNIISKKTKISDINVSRERHRRALKNTSQFLKSSLIDKSLDKFAEDIRQALKEITKITGNNNIEDVLDIIFSEFCIGK